MKKRKNETPLQGHTIPVHRKLRTKLIGAFLIPVVCIIFLGAASYKLASSAIIENYENSANQTMEMTNQYLSLAIDTVRSNYKSYLNDDDITKYFKGLLDNTTGKTLVLTSSKEVSRSVNTNNLICDIYLISDDLAPITSSSTAGENLYSAYTATEEGALVKENRASYFLFGNQCEADEQLGTSGADYSLRLAKHFNNGKAIMLIDFDKSLITDTLSTMDSGEGGYVALVTQDGCELYSDGTSSRDGIFSQSDFYNNAVQSQENGMEYVSLNGDRYLFLYAPLTSQSAMLCSLIPESAIMAQVATIKTVAIAMVLVASLIAALLGSLLSGHINGNIYYILRKLQKISAGDLTICLRSKAKDEFRLLADGVNAMTDSMKKLITNVTSASDSLSEAASQVSSSSETFLATSKDIRCAVSEIDSGVSQLDENSADCLTQMDSLSERIASVTQDTEQITSLTQSTGVSISTGISSMNELTESAKKTSEITDSVISAIKILAEKSRSIGQIVESINSIAQETNLLSLNASIEAARAGEAGRGFAVVAEQIRLLADQSADSAGQIRRIIDDIVSTTGNAVSIAGQAADTVQQQELAVSRTTDSFLSMDEQIHVLIDSIGAISDSMQNMEAARSATLNAIEEISSISAQTAAGSSNVTLTVKEQTSAIQTLDEAAGKLQMRAAELTELLRTFTI